MPMPFRRTGSSQEVHRVTSAQEGLSEDQSRRVRRYLISMSIRTVCFILLFITTIGWVDTPAWVQFALIAGAVFLPYLAVIAANAGRENDPFQGEAVPPTSHVEIESQGTRIIHSQ